MRTSGIVSFDLSTDVRCTHYLSASRIEALEAAKGNTKVSPHFHGYIIFIGQIGGSFCIGCSRNNQIFFSVQSETNRNSICFGCFSVSFAKPKKHFFRFVSVCFGVSDRY